MSLRRVATTGRNEVLPENEEIYKISALGSQLEKGGQTLRKGLGPRPGTQLPLPKTPGIGNQPDLGFIPT